MSAISPPSCASGSDQHIAARPGARRDVQVASCKRIVIGPDQVVNDDVYAFGSNVQILGTVNGDVFAAGNTVSIGGTVGGSVFAADNTVSVSGNVQHAVHAAANAINLSGPVAGDDGVTLLYIGSEHRSC